jgi:hypothetical protein
MTSLYVRTPSEIVADFVRGGFRHQANEANRVFHTDCTASTLVHVEGPVVIELYMLFPNIVAPMHSHPFANQMIFLGGDLTAHRAWADSPSIVRSKTFSPSDVGKPSGLMPIGDLHGFETGAAGAVMYNIQIWPEHVTDARSAAIAFYGPSMGPKHDALLRGGEPK